MNSSPLSVTVRYRACPLRRNACSGRSAAVVERDEATVRDGDAMGVAGEIGKHCFRPGEGRLGVDEPSLPLERGETCGEGLAVAQALDLTKERQPACRVGVGEPRQEEPPE